ncbi:MAG: TPM domain-containing protein [Myxococcales bacterium]
MLRRLPREPSSLRPPSVAGAAVAVAVLLLALASCELRQNTPAAAIPAAPKAWVTDRAGLLTPGTRESLDHRLENVERQTGHQVIVYIDRSTGGAPLEEWAARAFQAWGVGRKGQDDGAALFVLSDDRKARIEVGYGLEDRLTDALASQIVSQTLVPKMRAGNPDEAVAAAVDRLATAVGAPPQSGPGLPRTVARQAPAPSAGQLVFLVLVGLALLVLFATHPTLALWLLFNLASGGRVGGGGGGSRRGGFSGGGGRSGGGGASGSW